MDLLSSSALLALGQVLMINIVLSGDNAVVIGMVAARVAAKDQRQVVLWGMVAAVVLRVLLALVAVDLLNILGLSLAGGIILLWVAWRLYRDIKESAQEKEGLRTISEHADPNAPRAKQTHAALSLPRAIVRVAIADISMSVDNVLAIAGAASNNIPVLVIGLVVSIGLMGIAATYIAKLLQRYQWLSYVGVVLIVWVAAEMIWDGSGDLPQLLGFL